MSLDESIALLRAARFPEAEARLRSLVEGGPPRAEVLEMLGVAISAQGRDAEALPWFDRALAARPGHPSMLHNRARALFAVGRAADARADLENAVAKDPSLVASWTLLATVLAALGDVARAERAHHRALQLRPQVAEQHYNFGVFLQGAGRLEDAVGAYRRALELKPVFASAHNNLGNVLRGLGRYDDAFAEYAAAVRDDPGLAQAHLNWGAALREIGRVDEAMPRLQRALELKPDSPAALNNLGIAYYARHRYNHAIDCYRRALEASPGFPEALTNLGNALAAVGELDEAAKCHQEVIRLQPSRPEAHNNLGLLLQERGDAQGARASFERALEIDPANADAMNNLGLLLEAEGRREEAMAFFRRALEANPRLAFAAYNLSLAHLHRGEFAQGWELAGSRFETVPPQTPPRAMAMPRFTAADWGRGHRTAIWREQGLGDQLLYATLLPSFEKRGEAFTLEIDRRLIPSLARAHPAWELAALEDSAPAFARCDRHLAMGSLGELLRPDAASFAEQPRKLLAADEARSARMCAQLDEAKLRVGISWRSFQPKTRRRLERGKSAPLAAFHAISQRPGVQLLDLQYGDTADERAAFAAAGGSLARVEGLDLFHDIDGVLAAIDACDVVLTTSNVTAHLAGALGKRTLLVYLNAMAPFHYWALGPGRRSRWYPSVEIVTGPGIDSWDRILERAGDLL